MLSRKYEVAHMINLEIAELAYEKYGVINVVTDGKYLQLDKEEIKKETLERVQNKTFKYSLI